MTLPMQRMPTLQGNAVLVTGATGKVGRYLVQALLDASARVAILTRTPQRARVLWADAEIGCRAADLTDSSTLRPALAGTDVIFHLASHSPPPEEPDIYEAPAHWSVTAEGTRNLVEAALAAGVQRLVYVSSIKAMGDTAGTGGAPADESTPCAPDTLYGRAKLAAEHSVLGAGAAGRMHVSVVRVPMVYGLAGEGNIARMIDAVARHRFPPWPRIGNRRSAVHVLDLCAAVLLAARHPKANGQIYLVTDGAPYSTRWLYEQIRLALGRAVPPWTMPHWALRMVATSGTVLEKLTGRRMPLDRDGLRKLTGDAWFSCEKIRADLGFEPQHCLEQEIPIMVHAYLARTRNYVAEPGG